MMKYERFTWKTEKLQHLDDEVIIVVDNANKEWKGHILNIVDMLNDLNDERMMYKTTINKRIVELEEENEQLREENEQLKQQIKIEKKWQLEKDRYYVDLHKRYDKLEKENEQLEKDLLGRRCENDGNN